MLRDLCRIHQISMIASPLHNKWGASNISEKTALSVAYFILCGHAEQV
jgi:hypothetical protein